MDAHDKYVIRTALSTVKAAGGTGLTKDQILDQVNLANGEPLSNDEQEQAFRLLRDRGWITDHLDMWNDRRWCLSVSGNTVLQGL